MGEPFGTLVLALAVTVIEVALIVSVMLAGKAGSEALARDTAFAVVMLILNGLVGLSLLVGGVTHHDSCQHHAAQPRAPLRSHGSPPSQDSGASRPKRDVFAASPPGANLDCAA